MSGDVSFLELWMLQDFFQKRNIGSYTKHDIMRESPDHLTDAFLPMFTAYRKFCKHRIIIRGNRIIGFHTSIISDVWPLRQLNFFQRPNTWEETIGRILSIDTTFKAMTTLYQVLLGRINLSTQTI